ncbi:hypothetical protein COM24_07350 [Bacillus toyonensis]|uniref:hypothetical protein n=1 Tax=Bacillus TaxID=1386 RepID=UPI000BFA1CCE|nr:hypothetical protein [Bacillus toyonensis]PGC56619.1 hypothetical protein COM24_07350 [Bacillus toyonensis]
MTDFLIVTCQSFTDPSGVLARPDGEPGGEGWISLPSKEVVLGIYSATEEEDAIQKAAYEYGVSTEVLASYQLAKL